MINFVFITPRSVYPYPLQACIMSKWLSIMTPVSSCLTSARNSRLGLWMREVYEKCNFSQQVDIFQQLCTTGTWSQWRANRKSHRYAVSNGTKIKCFSWTSATLISDYMKFVIYMNSSETAIFPPVCVCDCSLHAAVLLRMAHSSMAPGLIAIDESWAGLFILAYNLLRR